MGNAIQTVMGMMSFFYVLAYFIVMGLFVWLVIKTKGDLLGEDKKSPDEWKKECKYLVKIEAKVGFRDELAEMAKWLNQHARHKYHSRYIEGKGEARGHIHVFFQNREEAARFMLEFK